MFDTLGRLQKGMFGMVQYGFMINTFAGKGVGEWLLRAHCEVQYCVDA